MFNLLIVEDEFEIREGLAFFDWSSIGIQVEGTCENGLTAYQKILEKKVDIILTDIRMPIMDGLKLIEHVHNEFPYIYIVVLSGYDEFDYIRACLRNRDMEYLLKPINKDELFTTFKNIVEKLIYDKQEMSKIKVLEKKARLAAPILRKEFLKKIFFSPLTEDEIEEGCIYSEISLDSKIFTVCVFRLDRVDEKRSQYSDKAWNLIILALEKVFEDVHDKVDAGFAWVNPLKGDIYLLITREDIQENNESLKGLISEIKDNIYNVGGIFRTTVSCGIGNSKNNPRDIYVSTQQAENAVESLEIPDDIAIFNLSVHSDKAAEILKLRDNKMKNKKEMTMDISSQEHIMDKVIRYVNENYNRSITLAEVSNLVSLNPLYLNYLFKEVTGINFIQYLTNYRIEKAKQFLIDPKCKIQYVSEAVGYESVKYFTYIFKKHTDKTPYEYSCGFKEEI